MTVLAIASLAKSFRAGTSGCAASVAVLREIDIALWPGEVVALHGAQGSGRTTLLHCAAGILRPDSGSVSWLGGRAGARSCAAYVSAEIPAHHDIAAGALYTHLERAAAARSQLLLVDDLGAVGALERRLAIAMLQECAAAGAAILLAADEMIGDEPFVTRALTLAHGVLTQRRKRSAVRMSASSFASRARASARSTYGRSFRSPQ